MVDGISDYCSKEGAEKLADRIANYWRSRGYPGIQTGVTYQVVTRRAMRDDDPRCYIVVSNIGPDGYPPA